MTRPNILLITTDQEHHRLTHHAGDAYVRTPTLDRLAQEGMRFDQTYVANPVCVPARYSLLSGHMPHCQSTSKFSDNWKDVCNNGSKRSMTHLRLAKEIRQLGCSVWDRHSHTKSGQESDSGATIEDSRVILVQPGRDPTVGNGSSVYLSIAAVGLSDGEDCRPRTRDRMERRARCPCS